MAEFLVNRHTETKDDTAYSQCMSRFSLLIILSSATAFFGGGGYTLVPRGWYDPACNIKGNTSINSNHHVFHVPGQKDYAATIIRTEYGERWFCAEADAREAGWRKASI